MTDQAKLVEELRTRAESYRMGGPSSEHTAALLDRAADLLASKDGEIAEAAPWVMFYRDGLDLGQIAEKLGGSIYDYSPWLYRPLLSGRKSDDALVVAEALTLSLRAENEGLKADVEALIMSYIDEEQHGGGADDPDCPICQVIAKAQDILRALSQSTGDTK